MMNEELNMMDAVYRRLQAPNLNDLDEKSLLLLFHQKNWRRMNKEDRLRTLQEVENRRAKTDGRTPVEIIVGSMPANTMGCHRMLPDGTGVIIINTRFVENGKLFGKLGGTSIFNAANALNTVLHEGRHAFQCHVVRHAIANISKRQRLEWAAVMPSENGLYNSGNSIFYFLQSIEMDARRFARRKVAQVNRMFISMGIQDQNFSIQTIKDLKTELFFICYVRLHMTHEMIDKYEKMVLDHFKKTHPELDLNGLRLFDHVRFILDHPEINDPKEMLDRLDRMADEKLGLKDGKLLNRLENAKLNGLKN